jgi:hypothetical protein
VGASLFLSLRLCALGLAWLPFHIRSIFIPEFRRGPPQKSPGVVVRCNHLCRRHHI